MFRINKENYLKAKEYLPNDPEITDWFGIMQDIIESPHLELEINEGARIEVDEFIKQLNDWAETGIINLPENFDTEAEVIDEPDKKKITPIFRKTRTTYMSTDDLHQKNNFPFTGNGNLSRFGVLNKKAIEPLKYASEIKDNPIKFAEDLPEPEEKKKDDLTQTIRTSYTLSEKDHKTIKELQLPESKIYIYKAIRSLFGKPIIHEKLAQYGINSFCRKLVNNYPEGYRMTEIKKVLDIVRAYDQIVD
jgi:hypothetical protein